jgi:hypothetical protein
MRPFSKAEITITVCFRITHTLNLSLKVLSRVIKDVLNKVSQKRTVIETLMFISLNRVKKIVDIQ